ncbi:hypothetical protein Trichorick_01653 (plasmid) [Candidatus Trichorickettsia mobilis]|nr:hypothetical protein Trichorick_01653 [Candidatus Trichorickettsia mobilis]
MKAKCFHFLRCAKSVSFIKTQGAPEGRRSVPLNFNKGEATKIYLPNSVYFYRFLAILAYSW